MMRRLLPGLSAFVAIALVCFLTPDALAAQSADLGAQRLGRPYLFVFVAYAVGWALILGWIISIARRLRSLESRIDRE